MSLSRAYYPIRFLGGVVLEAVGSGDYFLTVGIVPCTFDSARRFKMLAKRGTTSSNAAGQSGKSGWTAPSSVLPYLEKPTKLLNEREFRDHFCFTNRISIQLVEGDPMHMEKTGHNAMYSTKEQFNAELRFPHLSLFKQFLHYTQIPPTFIDPNIVRVLMGCSILNMLFHLDLSLLEVLFICTIKKGKKDIFNMLAHIPSFKLVIGLPNSNKGEAKGHALVRGAWAGLIEHLQRDFYPNHLLKIPGRDDSEHLLPVNILALG